MGYETGVKVGGLQTGSLCSLRRGTNQYININVNVDSATIVFAFFLFFQVIFLQSYYVSILCAIFALMYSSAY